MMRAMILAGGTGGHIYPGIAVAEALKARGIQVSWMGSNANMAMEKELVPSCFPLYTISVHQLRHKGIRAKLKLPFQLVYSVFQAVKILHKLKPDVCIAFGGFVAGPSGIATKLLGIPLVIHEQNARAGLTNRYLAKIARAVLQAFPDAFSNRVNAVTVGNPVRQKILDVPAPRERLAHYEGPLRILILGGSLGALALNEAIVDWLKHFTRRDELMVTHQTGKAHAAHFQDVYAQNKLNVNAQAYIDDMPTVLCATDVIICRAGALTVSEVADVGMAAIFIPMPHAVDNHQFHNASYLAKAKAAIMIEQKNLTVDTLSQAIIPFLDDRHSVLAMSERARDLAMRDATSLILKYIERSVV